MSRADASRRRCAIYTRKSSEEGLEQEFNSLAVDIVVVYEVDRLSRSLADFARLIEIFDAQGVWFVLVTQQFNTTSSMGRLTLNLLLSFAQLEREVTGERISRGLADPGQEIPAPSLFGITERCPPRVCAHAKRPSRAAERHALSDLVSGTSAAIDTT
jgi:Resolvase, N terminal domain